MTKDEKDRTLEIIFYYFFYNKLSNNKINKIIFWELIKKVNELYNINNIDISKLVKLLFDETNKPNELEVYYLLDKAKFSVREIVRISGIYYKKQRIFREKIENKMLTLPIKSIVNNIVLKQTLKKFIKSLIDFNTFLAYVDVKTIDVLF